MAVCIACSSINRVLTSSIKSVESFINFPSFYNPLKGPSTSPDKEQYKTALCLSQTIEHQKLAKAKRTKSIKEKKMSQQEKAKKKKKEKKKTVVARADDSSSVR